jgi:membrane-associated phospholipid phosphatase
MQPASTRKTQIPTAGRPAATRSLLVFFSVLGVVHCWAGAGTIENAGNILQLVLPGAAAGLTLAYRDGQGAFEFGESAGVTLGVTYALKYSINERRPNGGNESFPSGHASISFAAAEFMRKRYGWEYGIPAYATATFVAYSRVEARQHHTYDVVGGAAIGIASSFIFTKPYKGWLIEALADGKHYGLKFSRSW